MKILFVKKLVKFFIIFCGVSLVKNRCSNEWIKVVIIFVNGLYKNILSRIGILLKLIFKKLNVGIIGNVINCNIVLIVVNIVMLIIFCILLFIWNFLIKDLFLMNFLICFFVI